MVGENVMKALKDVLGGFDRVGGGCRRFHEGCSAQGDDRGRREKKRSLRTRLEVFKTQVRSAINMV